MLGGITFGDEEETRTFFFLFLQLSQRFFVATPTMMNH
jgi:hypothetical protein